MYISKHSGMDHTVLPANTPCLPLGNVIGGRKKEKEGGEKNIT